MYFLSQNIEVVHRSCGDSKAGVPHIYKFFFVLLSFEIGKTRFSNGYIFQRDTSSAYLARDILYFVLLVGLLNIATLLKKCDVPSKINHRGIILDVV